MGRLACWVIVTDSAPTAFRANTPEELQPTLKQLQRTQPDAVLKWFSRGQLWESPLAAIEALRAKRQARKSPENAWRPGGAHADPRAKYQLTRDQKRARFKRRQFGEWQSDQPRGFEKTREPRDFRKPDRPGNFGRPDKPKGFGYGRPDRPQGFGRPDQPKSFGRPKGPKGFGRPDRPKSFGQSGNKPGGFAKRPNRRPPGPRRPSKPPRRGGN